MGLVLFGLSVFPKVLNRKKEKYQRNPTKTKQSFWKTHQKTMFLKVSDAPLDMGLVLFGLSVFPKVKKKEKEIRENIKYQRKPTKTNKAKIPSVFPKVVWVFFGFILYFWLSRMFFVF